MATSALFSLGVKTMTASYAQLQTTGHNIANAHVEGYSRQTTELATSRGQFSGSGFFGKGVDVVTVTRTHNEFVAREADAAQTVATMDAARLTQVQALEQVFRTGESGLGHAAGQFFNSMVDLASRPGDSSTRQVVLARAEEVANRFAHAAQQLDTLQRSATADLTSAVSEVNGLGGNIAEVNGKIAALTGLGQPANDLLDERDRLVSKLNSIIQVSTIPAEDGSLSVFISGDQRLVLGTQVVKLQLLADETDPSRAGVGFTENGRDRQIDGHTLSGGTIAGLLRFQNDDLVAARNLVGRLAVAVAGASNEQQMLGLNLYPPAGSVPSEPFFRVGDPRAVPSRSNTRDAAGNYLASVSLSVTDASQLQASDYSLRADPSSGPGNYLITRLSDGVVRGIASGDEVDGFRVDVGTPAPDISDRFLLQAVSRGANGMRLLLDDPRDVAAASPLVATALPAATGTVSVDSLRMISLPPNPNDTVRITFTSDAGNYQWDLLDASGAVLSTATGVWQAGESIPAPPADMNGFELKLLGVPRASDVFMIEPADPAHLTQNNGNALSLAALRDASIVDGVTATDAYATAMSDVGVRVQGATTSSQISEAMSQQARNAHANASGVNLDEEAARLIQYQQSYQAAAKVLQVAQSVFDTLLSIGGR